MTTDKIILEAIQNILDSVEDRGYRIIFAIESGSRLWGMSSPDSDYDVRFVYVKPITKYLAMLGNSSEQIDIVDMEHNIDAVGWDVKKFISLASKSNPSAMEWLTSDIVYRGDTKKFKEFMKYFNPRALFEHYYSMAKSNYMRYIAKETGNVPIKKYLYIMRALVNQIFVMNRGVMPPIDIKDALKEISDNIPFEVVMDIHKLIDIKRSGEELGPGPRIHVLDIFINNMMNNIDEFRKQFIKVDVDKDFISFGNQLFMETIGLQ